VLAKVNGTKTAIRNGEHLTLVKGDVIEILSANLDGTQNRPGYINFVGLPGRDENNKLNDTNVEIRTDKDLLESWSISKGEEVYKISVKTRGTEHGSVFLRIVEPKLKYAVININGKDKILRSDETLNVGNKDMVKVSRVETNLPEIAQDVLFQIIPIAGGAKGSKKFEIRFLRNEKMFAKIPMLVATDEASK
jgi:hypothetical protein